MDLDHLLHQQHGLVTRGQLAQAGVPTSQLGTGRRFLRVRHGVYVHAACVPRAEADGVPLLLQVLAAQLVSAVPLVAGGATAAALHELPLLGPPPRRLQLHERKQARPLHHGCSTDLAADEVVGLDGVAVTSLARTASDVGRSRGYLAGVVIMDAALARGVTPEGLDRGLRDRETWPGAAHARRALAFADGRAESALESLGRVRFAQQGLPPPDLQVWRRDGHSRVARVDHYWHEHRTVAEADGALKYATPSDLWEEKRREDRLRELGDEVVRYTWDEALHRPELVAERVRRAFARAAARSAA